MQKRAVSLFVGLDRKPDGLLRGALASLALLLGLSLLPAASPEVWAQPPACAIDDLSGGIGTIPGSQRFTVTNNCAKDVVLLFNAGVCNSQWGKAFGADTVNYYSVDYRKTAIAAGSSQTFCVPDAGGCSGNMYFAYNCVGNDPTAACDLAGDPGIFTHTLGEFTAGCKYMVPGQEGNTNPPYSNCNTNPSDGHDPKWKLSSVDSFDVSAVNGYTLPMSIAVAANGTLTCNTLLADGSMLDLASCPTEYGYSANRPQTLAMTPADAITYAATTYSVLTSNPNGISLLGEGTGADGSTPIYTSCASPCKWFSTQQIFGNPTNPQAVTSNDPNPPASTYDFYCCYNKCGQNACGDPDPGCACSCPGCRGKQCSVGPLGTYKKSIVTSNFVTRLKEVGYPNYTWQYDDASGNKQCSWTDPSTVVLGTYTLTLCPNGGDPPSKNNKWRYDGASSKCIVDNASGTYTSLFACLTQDPVASTKFELVTDTIIGNDPNYPDGTAKYCSWNATSGTLSYASCRSMAYPNGITPVYDLLIIN